VSWERFGFGEFECVGRVFGRVCRVFPDTSDAPNAIQDASDASDAFATAIYLSRLRTLCFGKLPELGRSSTKHFPNWKQSATNKARLYGGAATSA